MNVLVTARPYTPEDLLELPEGDHYELVDGRLVEQEMGLESSWIAGEVARVVGNFCRERQLGWVFTADPGFQCFPGRPNLVRKPDVAFVRRGRFPDEALPAGFTRLAPDLAVEVVSPKDLAEELLAKISEYLAAGVRLLWVVSPQTRTVYAYRPDGSAARLTETQELTGDDVLPGFRHPVGDLFPPPAPAASPAPSP